MIVIGCSGKNGSVELQALPADSKQPPTVESLATTAVANAASSLTAECAFEGNCVLVPFLLPLPSLNNLLPEVLLKQDISNCRDFVMLLCCVYGHLDLQALCACNASSAQKYSGGFLMALDSGVEQLNFPSCVHKELR